MNRNLALEFVRVTEMAAIASARLTGRGEEKAADQAAVDSMRSMLDSVECDAKIVIGEGERDEAPMLYIGEKVGSGNGPELEIAVDPLEGTTICAVGGYNSISVMAIGEKGNLMHAPDTYMKKIAVITPYYNEDLDLIKKANESVLNQNNKEFECEHIIIVDGYDNNNYLKNLDCFSLELKENHKDNGNTPRSFGTNLAISKKYD